MDYILVLLIFGFIALSLYKAFSTVGEVEEAPEPPMKTTANSSAGVAFTPSSQEEYELIQFDEAMFTGGTTSQRFQERVGWYIKNGYRIHTMNVVVKQGWFAGQKQTYTVLFEKLPQPMSEGAAMLNS